MEKSQKPKKIKNVFSSEFSLQNFLKPKQIHKPNKPNKPKKVKSFFTSSSSDSDTPAKKAKKVVNDSSSSSSDSDMPAKKAKKVSLFESSESPQSSSPEWLVWYEKFNTKADDIMTQMEKGTFDWDSLRLDTFILPCEEPYTARRLARILNKLIESFHTQDFLPLGRINALLEALEMAEETWGGLKPELKAVQNTLESMTQVRRTTISTISTIPSVSASKKESVQQTPPSFSEKHYTTEKYIKDNTVLTEDEETEEEGEQAYDYIRGEYINAEKWLSQNPNHILLYTSKREHPILATDRVMSLFQPWGSDVPMLYQECLLNPSGMFKPQETAKASPKSYFKLDSQDGKFAILLDGAQAIPKTQRIKLHETHRQVWLIQSRKIDRIPNEPKDMAIKKNSCTVGAYPQTVSDLLYRYSRHWDTALNGYLRQGETYFSSRHFGNFMAEHATATEELYEIQHSRKRIIQGIKDMDKKLQEAFLVYGETSEKDILLYRGVKDQKSIQLPLLMKTMKLEERGILSTTIDDSIADEFAGPKGYIFEITVPAFTPFLTLCHSSHVPREKELIFPKNSQIDFTSTEGKTWQGVLKVPSRMIRKRNPCQSYQVVRLLPFSSSSSPIEGGSNQNMFHRASYMRRMMDYDVSPEVDEFLWFLGKK